MQAMDHILVLLLLVVQPIWGYIESRRDEARAQAGHDLNRQRFYRQTAWMEWVFLAALAAVWVFYERPITALGFVQPGGTGFWIGVGLLIVVLAGLAYSVHYARHVSESERTKQVASMGALRKYLPHTRTELNTFYGLSVTAGVVEEIVYRGFLFWYLSFVMPLWLVVVASSVMFGFAHSYQGAGGALRCGLVGLGFGLYYALTGSIWLPIIAHALFDILQGAAIFELLRKDDDGLKPQTA